MDRLGLLAAAAAIVAFPGGAFAVAAGLLASGGSGVRLRSLSRAGARARSSWDPATIGGLAVLAMGAALVPLPGSPLHALPSGTASQNLLATLLLIGVAAVLCGGPLDEWDRLRAGVAAACVAPVLALCAAAASFTPDLVAGLGDRNAGVARILAGLTLVLAAPSLADGAGAAARWAVAGVVAIFALALAEPSTLASAPGAVSALAALGAALAAGVIGKAPARLRSTAAIASGAAATAFALTLL